MNKSIVFFAGLVLLMGFGTLFAQTSARTYVIVDKAGIADLQPYYKALDKANLENYRLEDSRRRMDFDNGIKVDLLSVNELQAFGIEVSATARKVAKEPKREAVFAIRNGYLLEMVRPVKRKGHR